MADLEASKIHHENHLLLDQSCLRLPYELLRKNFRPVHQSFEITAKHVKEELLKSANGSLNGTASPHHVVKELDQMLVKMRGLKRKLTVAVEEEDRLYRQLDARVAHLRELSAMNTVDDAKYEAWSRQRLDRLLVDYMLRHGYDASATALAEERGMRDLVDVDTFVVMSRIRKSLEAGSVQEALHWCNENKKELRKMESNLEFMLRCQQYIEMMRTASPAKMLDAITHAKKYIIPFQDTYPDEVSTMAGLLAYGPDTNIEPYKSLYSESRWHKLADTFVDAHLKLLNLPMTPLLHVALSTGLSALKTPACHGPNNNTHTPRSKQQQQQQQQRQQQQSNNATPTQTTQQQQSQQPLPPPPPPAYEPQPHQHHHHHHGTASLTTRVCPICSTELNALARRVRYAHHSKSRLLEHDLVLLPNGRVYGRARLDEYAAKSGLPAGKVKDLVTGEVFEVEGVRKVFVT
ncbi:hypothetical protein VTJ49DRAFT_371 [Mycothermus thermophilus]|uniref:Protein FYV10 n=1 Tax=Humicola insolens TaxID=85995 RepID=A0ABR3VQ63_HUMIN